MKRNRRFPSEERYSASIPEPKSPRQQLTELLLGTVSHGAARRAAIMALIREHDFVVAVNRRYCLIVKKDRDIQLLLARGELVRRRVGFGSHTSKITYIALPTHKFG